MARSKFEEPTEREMIKEVAQMIKDWRLKYEENDPYYDWDLNRYERCAVDYLRFVHNEVSTYSTTERLNYLAWRFSVIWNDFY